MDLQALLRHILTWSAPLTPSEEAKVQDIYQSGAAGILRELKTYDGILNQTSPPLERFVEFVRQSFITLHDAIGDDRQTVWLRIAKLLLNEAETREIDSFTIELFTQTVISISQTDYGYGTLAPNRDQNTITMVYDHYISNQSFFTKAEYQEIFQNAGVPPIVTGLNRNDTLVVAAIKGRKWGIKLSDAAAPHIQLLKQQAQLPIDELYRRMFSDDLRNAENRGTDIPVLQGLGWSDAHVRSFFQYAGQAFLKDD